MIRGFIAGGFWGAILGVIALAMTSQMADWRDLTPAVTETETAEEILPDVPPDPSDGAQDAPVVTAGTGAVQPESPDQPESATETAPEIAAPSLETSTASAPAPINLPETVSAPGAPAPDTGGIEVAAIEAMPSLQTAGDGAGDAPGADTLPKATDTQTALTPARLAPTPQTGISGLDAPLAETNTPDVPVAAAPAQPDRPVQSAALAPAVASPEAAPSLPSAPSDPPVAAVPGEGQAPDVGEAGNAPAAPAADDAAGAVAEAPTAPAAPVEEPSAPVAPVETAGLSAPEAPERVTAPSPVETPQSIDVAELQPETAPAAPEAPSAPEADAPEAAEGLQTPEAPAAPERVATDPPAVPEPDVTQADAPSVPAVAEAAPAETDPAPETVAVVAPDTAPAAAAPLPEPTPVADERRAPRVTRIGSEGGSTMPGVRIRRLPSIGDDAAEEDAGTVAVGAAAAEVADAAAADPDAPALVRNAEEFEAGGGDALLSIVLTHEPGAAIEPLPVPMTFAVSAALPDAGDVARAYREAGHEVALIPDLPAGALAQDVEVALQVNLADVPVAVALIDATGDGFQGNRAAVAQIVATAAGSGHAVVTRAQGLDGAGRLAAREGVTAARIFGALDPDVTDRAAIGRALDRAAFRARADGQLILSGKATPEQVAGILAWALENRGGEVALAPLSAALRSGGES